jgi:HAD superfamily hydrolase (TIGR01509 family)
LTGPAGPVYDAGMAGPHPRITAAIFDMDGLMFDTERIAVQAWQRAGRATGCEISEALVIESMGRDARDARVLFERVLGPSFDFGRTRALRVQYAEEIIDTRGVPVKDGLAELLALLAGRGVRKGLATSAERDRTEALLAKAHLAAHFDVVVCGDEVERGKPAPDIFLRAADRLGVAPAECVVLEDSESGVRAAASAGMRPLMVPDLKPATDEMKSIAERVLPDLRAAAAYLSQILPS